MKVKYEVTMAILREFFSTRADGVNLYRTYSDAGMMLLQNETGIEYSEAVDIENAPYTYSETANPIDDEQADVLNPQVYDILNESEIGF